MATAQTHTAVILMPKATAVWMIDNTALTFAQIAHFTNLTEIEIEALANEEIGKGIVGRNPVEHGEMTQEELDRAEANPAHIIRAAKRELPAVKSRAKGPRYTPVSKRGDKPDAIAYILKNTPEITDAQICKLVGTTKPTVDSIRDRSHPNSSNLRPRHPAELGLCTYQEFENAYNKGLKAAGKDPEAMKAAQEEKLRQEAEAHARAEEDEAMSSSTFDFSNFLAGTMTKSNSNND